MSKPSGKPRKHGRNVGGRPSNKERFEEQQQEILRLRQLVVRRRYTDETWQMIDRILKVVNELEDLATPQRGISYDEKPSPAVERPVLPGVHITNDGRIVHAGTYADDLYKWFHRTVRWTVATTERRLTGKEPDPRPRPPKRETIKSVAEREIQSVER